MINDLKMQISQLVSKHQYIDVKNLLINLDKHLLQEVLYNYNKDFLLLTFIYKKNVNSLNCIKERHELLKYLIDITEQLYLEDSESCTIFNLFIKYQDNNLLQYLFNKNPKLVNYINANDLSVLDFCVLYNNKNALDIIFNFNPMPNIFGRYILSSDLKTLSTTLNYEEDPMLQDDIQYIFNYIHNKLILYYNKQNN